MKNLIIIIFIVFLSVFVFFQIADARSGCCSWHGGVCGCRCCDGTPLSAKCAPYYPSCSSPDAPKYDPPKSYNSPEPNTKPNSYNQGQKTYTADVSKTSEEKSNSWIWWMIGIIAIGGIAYNYGKNKKEK